MQYKTSKNSIENKNSSQILTPLIAQNNIEKKKIEQINRASEEDAYLRMVENQGAQYD